MKQAPIRKPRVVVCGTTFGKFYLEAFRAPNFPLELAGILARGTSRSVESAKHFGVTLYSNVDEVPDVDMVCVVVRAGILGGKGTDLAQAFLNRRIPVLQEHPLHYDELAQCLRCARSNQVYYGVNAFYPHLEPVRRLIRGVSALRRHERLLYIDAMCGFQAAYSMIDILSHVGGGIHASGFEKGLERRSGRPFVSVEGSIAGIPLTLRVQNQLDPADPDNFAHILHRITVGTASGNLILVNDQGPLIWNSRLHVPASTRDHHGVSTTVTESLNRASSVAIGPRDELSWEQALAHLWPAAAGQAMIEFMEKVQAGRSALDDGQAQLSICKMAGDLTQLLGPPELIAGDAEMFTDVADILDDAARLP